MMNLPTAIEPDMVRKGTPLAAEFQPAIGGTEAQWNVNTTTYCPHDYGYVGGGFTAETCQAECVGLCKDVFLSTEGKGDCYTCAAGAASEYSKDYTLYSKTDSTITSADCLAACNANAACMSWNFATAAQTCTLQKDAPNVFYALGNDCGLRGEWSYSNQTQCLMLSRPGAGGSNGDMSICASSSTAGAAASFGTYDAAGGAFADLASAPASLNGVTAGAHGAIVVSAMVPPASNATLTITFGWYFPERDHFGKVFGNYYKNLFTSSADAAFGSVAPAARETSLASIVSDVLAMQTPFHGSSLDPWLQDHLVNSLSHIRTAMWFDTCPNCHKTASRTPLSNRESARGP